jgi:CheY-like chemotaxis protein
MPVPQPPDPPANRLTPFAGPIFAPNLPPQMHHDLPLQGLTVLAVEDSRFACEALRLMCQRGGARLRRADTLAAAQAHLRVYRPDVVIVDLGLPDGRGEGLIRDLVLSPRRPKMVLGTSGNPDGRATALAAGAVGFLEKPLESLATLCRALSRHLPDLAIVPPAGADPGLTPDRLALQDDLAHAAAALGANPDAAERHYLAGFLRGLARHTQDEGLEAAAVRAESGEEKGLLPLVTHRLTQTGPAFGGGRQKA